MLHPTVASRYVPQRTHFLRLLRTAFGLAGLFWFVIYALPITDHADLRARQSVIYFILLSVWGLDYMREQRRLAVIITAANALGRTPDAVTIDDIQDRVQLFTMTSLWHKGRPQLLTVIFWGGVVVALGLVIRNYIDGLPKLFGF